MLVGYFSLGCFNPADSKARGHGPRYALIWAQVALSKSFFVGSLPSSLHLQRRRSSAQAFFSSGVTCIPPLPFCGLTAKKKAQPICPQVRTNQAALSCQSVIDPNDRPGSLTHGIKAAKHSNGRLFRFLTGSPRPIVSAIFNWSAGCDRQGYPCGRGNPQADGHSKKAAAGPSGPLQPFFRNKKITGSVLADPCVFPHLSSSPDLRIISSA